MAAFPTRDREAFDAHWAKILKQDKNIIQVIETDSQVAGYICSWETNEGREVGYWLGRDFWGKGFATQALAQFLGILDQRPLLAHVAEHNIGSIRVLEKCGFKIIGKHVSAEDDLTEIILQLD